MHTRYTRMYTLVHASFILFLLLHIRTHTHTHIYIQTSIKYLCVTIIIVLRLSKFFSFFFSLKTAHKILLEKYV